MRQAQVLFHDLARADDLEAAIGALSAAELREITGAIEDRKISGWAADIIHGVCLVEAAKRFLTR